MKTLFVPQWMTLLAVINDNEVKFLSEKFENDTTITFLAKKTLFDYNSVEKNIRLLEAKGYIKTERRHRSRYVSLTDKGRTLSFYMCKIKLTL